MTEREKIRNIRQRKREREVQKIKDIIAIICVFIFMLIPSLVNIFVEWVVKVLL